MARKATAEQEWREFLTVGNPRLHRLRGWFRLVPEDPRCVSCCVPFEGPAAVVFKSLGFRRFDKNPRWCSNCFNHLDKRQRGGAVLEISMLFADVRGSTPMAEGMTPAAFHDIIDRFYVEGTRVLIDHDALIERFMGDQIVAYFVPSFAGSAHARRAVDAGLALQRVTGHGEEHPPWIPIGVGVHTGEAFIGTIGDPGQVVNFTALGDNVTLGARLASTAADGEVMLSESSAAAAGLPGDAGEHRSIAVKGKQGEIAVRVLTVAPGPRPRERSVRPTPTANPAMAQLGPSGSSRSASGTDERLTPLGSEQQVALADDVGRDRIDPARLSPGAVPVEQSSNGSHDTVAGPSAASRSPRTESM